MSFISTSEYAAWHIPCYANHNCPRKVKVSTEVTVTATPKSTSYAGIGALVSIDCWSFKTFFYPNLSLLNLFCPRQPS